MTAFGDQFQKRRAANARAIKQAFGVDVPAPTSEGGARYRTVRSGGKITIFTIGYEQRNGEELISLLRDAGVEVLADIREKAFSRVADFRAGSLQQLCAEAGIVYEGWPELGSTEGQRERLKETGDFKRFESVFRSHVLQHAEDALERLAAIAKRKSVALLCYERLHEDCHRSVVADLLADRLKATVVAI